MSVASNPSARRPGGPPAGRPPGMPEASARRPDGPAAPPRRRRPGGRAGRPGSRRRARRRPPGRVVEVGRGEGPGRVVHRDHVDLAGLDGVGEQAEGLPLRRVPRLPAGHHRDLGRVGGEVRLDRRAHGLLLAVAHHQHHPSYAGDGAGGRHRAGDHRDAAERQEHLVDLGADAGPGAGRQHDDGRPHQWTSAVAIAAMPSPRPVRPSPSVVVAESETGAPTASWRTAVASSRRGPSRGRLPITWTATFAIS